MDDGCRATRSTTAPTANSGRHTILALNVLEQALDDIGKNGRKTSRCEKLLRGLGRNLERNLERTRESEQLYAMCKNSLLDWTKRK